MKVSVISKLREDLRRTIADAPPAIAFAALSQLAMVYAIELSKNDAEKAKTTLKNQSIIACAAIDEACKTPSLDIRSGQDAS